MALSTRKALRVTSFKNTPEFLKAVRYGVILHLYKVQACTCHKTPQGEVALEKLLKYT